MGFIAQVVVAGKKVSVKSFLKIVASLCEDTVLYNNLCLFML